MKVLYFDCFSGISGDMTLGALLDLGVDQRLFQDELNKLHLEGYTLQVSRSVKNGITGNHVEVVLDGEQPAHVHGRHDHPHGHTHEGDDHHHGHSHEGHGHPQEHPHGHTHEGHDHHHDHSHVHSHEDHPHEHPHKHSHEGAAHHHRSFQDIKTLIHQSEISAHAKELSLRIFERLAAAEGKIHGVPMEEVHFHEVGAVDSIVDIVGAAILLDMLGVEKLASSPVPVGSGMVRCQHGLIPVPAPAALELLKGVPVYAKGIKGEMVTPTGAAIISALCSEFGEYPAMVVEGIGYGIGKKDFDIPNCLRVCIGTTQKK